jgi:hypothetical protein
MTFTMRIALTFLLLAASLACSAQSPNRPQPRPITSGSSPIGNQVLVDNLRAYNQRRYPGSPSTETGFAALNDMVQRESQQTNSHDTYLEQQRLRAAAEQVEAQRRDRERRELALNGVAPQARANPDAPDQSELLRNSHDRDFILHNFHTMYVDAREAHYFDSQQMKAALGKNKDFAGLNINIVDDPRVADTVLNVSYTFAWDYPFALRHQNTTIVLVSGKGEGPFSGPLGAADVARQFVKTVKEWRVVKEKPGH